MNGPLSPLPLEITCEDVRALQQSGEEFIFIDCREPDEYELCRIDGTMLLPCSESASWIGDLEPHRARRIVVHCHIGGRSWKVANVLRKLGFAHAQSMAGGIDTWSALIDPTVPRYSGL